MEGVACPALTYVEQNESSSRVHVDEAREIIHCRVDDDLVECLSAWWERVGMRGLQAHPEVAFLVVL